MKKTFLFFWVIALVLIVLFVAAPPMLDDEQNVVVAHQPYSVSEQAQALHSSLIIGDWHADSLLWMRDLTQQYDYGHLDFPRMQQGNIALQMFTTVTKSPSGQNYDRNSSDASDNITLLGLAQRWPLATWTSLAERALFQADKLHELAARDADNLTADDFLSSLRLRRGVPVMSDDLQIVQKSSRRTLRNTENSPKRVPYQGSLLPGP